MPWWGPVLAPVLISALMILWGTLASQFEQIHTPVLSNWRVWLLNFTGVALALYVFMADTIVAAHRGLEAIRMVLPERFNWQLFGVALALMSAPLMKIGWQVIRLQRAKSAIAEPSEEFGCTRNPNN